MGFSVLLDSGRITVPGNTKVEWPVVRTNVGGGFDPATSDFICPVDGTYMFNVDTLVHWDDVFRAGLEILHDGSLVVASIAQSNDVYGAASSTVVLQCNSGQRVWVRCETCCACEMMGGPYTSFTGFLLGN